MEQTVIAWLAHFGAPALFALLMIGVFGLPIPDETILVVAGLLVGRGQLRAVPTAVAAIGGAVVGITVSYWIGRFAGLPLLVRYGAAIHVDQPLMTRVSGWFARYGKWLLTVGYFVPGIRHLTAVVAGASRLSGWTFSAFAFSGAVLWVSCFLAIGYVLGDQWRAFVSDLHRHVAIVSSVVVAAASGYVWWVRARAAPRE